MKAYVSLFTLLVCSLSASKVHTYKRPERVGLAEYGMATVGSVVAGVTSWGGYLLWNWASMAVTPESWDETLGIIGRGGLYGLGYGLFIPVGASTGVVTVAIGAGEEHQSWGAILGGYVGSAGSLPFAVMAIQDPTWLKASLAAASVILLPPVCSWAGYHLTPHKGRETSQRFQVKPYLAFDTDGLTAGLNVRFQLD